MTKLSNLTEVPKAHPLHAWMGAIPKLLAADYYTVTPRTARLQWVWGGLDLKLNWWPDDSMTATYRRTSVNRATGRYERNWVSCIPLKLLRARGLIGTKPWPDQIRRFHLDAEVDTMICHWLRDLGIAFGDHPMPAVTIKLEEDHPAKERDSSWDWLDLDKGETIPCEHEYHFILVWRGCPENVRTIVTCAVSDPVAVDVPGNFWDVKEGDRFTEPVTSETRMGNASRGKRIEHKLEYRSDGINLFDPIVQRLGGVVSRPKIDLGPVDGEE